MTGTVASLAGEFVSATLGLAEEDLPEGFLVGVQVLLEAVRRQLVTLTGLLPAEAAATLGASTCRNTQSTWDSLPTPKLDSKAGEGLYRESDRGQGQRAGSGDCFCFAHSRSPITLTHPSTPQGADA